jgi:TIR domain
VSGLSASVFISYRRDDVADATDRLAAALKARFGNEAVFADVNNIRIGEDFGKVIESYIARCDVLLAVIGPHWLDKRLADPDDWVRIEIESALRCGVRVVPVLMYGAQMPDKEALPVSLQPILRLQWKAIPRDFFDVAVGQLIDGIEQIAAAKHVAAEPPVLEGWADPRLARAVTAAMYPARAPSQRQPPQTRDPIRDLFGS